VTALLKEYLERIPERPNQILELLSEMQDIFSKERNIIKISRSPCLFIGDTHGDLNASKKVVQRFLEDPHLNLIFLGDYVDRGLQQLENVLFLFMLKKDYPRNIILLRGNHEEEQMNINYGFRDLLFQTFGKAAETLFTAFQQTFAQLPLSVLTWNRIFGVHGGIPVNMKDISIKLEEIAKKVRGATHLNDFDFITAQMLWNDPKEGVQGAIPSHRGIGFFFGPDKFQQFTDTNNIEFVVRSHEVFQNGFKYFFNKKLVSIFSALDYVYLHGIEAKILRLEEDGGLNLLNIA
jgi:predicted phosphodiesterase